MTEGEGAEPWADWYAQGDAAVQQGDILHAFPVVTPVDLGDDGSYTFATRTQAIIILTQTCDVPKAKQRTLMAASVHPYDLLAANTEFDYLRTSAYQVALSRGDAIADFLLPPTPGSELPWSIVHFRDIFVVPKSAVIDTATHYPPTRLASPYKEYLSQAFARFMMRVALPSTLDAFTKRDKA